MAQIKTSKKGSLNKRDFLKAAIIAALTPVLVLIQNSIDAGVFTFHWKTLLMTAIGGFVAYLLKNWLTPSQIILTGDDVNQAVQEKSENEKSV